MPSHSHSALQYVGRTCSERDERTSKCSITTASSRRSACLLAPHAKHRQRQQSERLAPHNRYAAHSCHSADAASQRTDRNTYDSDDDNTHTTAFTYLGYRRNFARWRMKIIRSNSSSIRKRLRAIYIEPRNATAACETPVIQSILSY